VLTRDRTKKAKVYETSLFVSKGLMPVFMQIADALPAVPWFAFQENTCIAIAQFFTFPITVSTIER
jgi:hypothetical protein